MDATNVGLLLKRVNNCMSILNTPLNLNGTDLPTLDFSHFNPVTLKISIAYVCLEYDITLIEEGLLIEKNKIPLILSTNFLTQLPNSQGGGDNDEITTFKATKSRFTTKSISNILWFLTTILTFYITTNFANWLSLDSLRNNVAIANVHINTFSAELNFSPSDEPSLQSLLTFVEMYNDLSPGDAKNNGIILYNDNSNLLAIVSEINNSKGQLLLPPPIDTAQIEESVALTSWNTLSVFVNHDSFTDTIMKPFSEKYEQLHNAAANQKQQIEDIIKMGEQLSTNINNDIENIKESANSPMGVFTGVVQNLGKYMTEAGTQSSVGNFKKKMDIAKEIAVLLPVVTQKLSQRIPNLPRGINDVYGIFQKITLEIYHMYVITGLISTLLLGIFGRIIAFIMHNVSPENQQKNVNEVFEKLHNAQKNMGAILFDLLSQSSLTETQINAIVATVAVNMLPSDLTTDEITNKLEVFLNQPDMQKVFTDIKKLNDSYQMTTATDSKTKNVLLKIIKNITTKLNKINKESMRNNNNLIENGDHTGGKNKKHKKTRKYKRNKTRKLKRGKKRQTKYKKNRSTKKCKKYNK